MKKLLSLIIFVLIILSMTSYHKNPYYGKYICQVNANITLNLNKDNSYNLINTFNKDAESSNGKYTITDNQITLIPKEDNSCFFNDKTIKGKVEGTRITLSNFLANQNCIFNKQ